MRAGGAEGCFTIKLDTAACHAGVSQRGCAMTAGQTGSNSDNRQEHHTPHILVPSWDFPPDAVPLPSPSFCPLPLLVRKPCGTRINTPGLSRERENAQPHLLSIQLHDVTGGQQPLYVVVEDVFMQPVPAAPALWKMNHVARTFNVAASCPLAADIGREVPSLCNFRICSQLWQLLAC